ncbi:MAG: hypothetical protein FWB80_03565 [Defluviitaleaceae bacterium]|nr:hypothetical protein [Defluviitaleaceae bacterium]
MNRIYLFAKGEVLIGRQKKEIKSTLHLPKSENAIRRFEETLIDFYAAQVEKGLQSFPKEKKLEILDIMIESIQYKVLHKINQ